MATTIRESGRALQSLRGSGYDHPGIGEALQSLRGSGYDHPGIGRALQSLRGSGYDHPEIGESITITKGKWLRPSGNGEGHYNHWGEVATTIRELWRALQELRGSGYDHPGIREGITRTEGKWLRPSGNRGGHYKNWGEVATTIQELGRASQELRGSGYDHPGIGEGITITEGKWLRPSGNRGGHCNHWGEVATTFRELGRALQSLRGSGYDHPWIGDGMTRTERKWLRPSGNRVGHYNRWGEVATTIRELGGGGISHWGEVATTIRELRRTLQSLRGSGYDHPGIREGNTITKGNWLRPSGNRGGHYNH